MAIQFCGMTGTIGSGGLGDEDICGTIGGLGDEDICGMTDTLGLGDEDVTDTIGLTKAHVDGKIRGQKTYFLSFFARNLNALPTLDVSQHTSLNREDRSTP